MFFVFKYFLASFPLFFIFCSSLQSPVAGPFRFPLRHRAPWCSLATICPEQDHHDRLSQPGEAVKRKIQKNAGKCDSDGRIESVRMTCRLRRPCRSNGANTDVRYWANKVLPILENVKRGEGAPSINFEAPCLGLAEKTSCG